MVTSILISIMSIIHFGKCLVTDKEYARLPPVFELDNFDRCMLLQDEALYCAVKFYLRPIDPNKPSPTWNKIKELNTDPKNYHHDTLRHGICVPLTCPNISTRHVDSNFKNELGNCYSKKYEKDGLYGEIGYMHCQTNESSPMDYYDLIVAWVFMIYLLFIVFASFYEGLARYKPKVEYDRITGSSVGKVISSFSVMRNWIRLTTVNLTPETEVFKPFQGVRFYNFVMVIICHSSILYTIGPVINTKSVETLFDNPGTIFVASGPYVVGTFFLLTSWLVTYNILLNFDENSEKEFDLKTLFLILLNRFIRLTPALAVVIVLHSTLLFHFSTGPWWDLLIGRERTNCRKNGWMNLLYINNLVNDASESCFLETWYTAVDMHGFILVLIILYFTAKNPHRLLWLIPSVWLVIQAIFLKRAYDLKIHTYLMPYSENLYQLHDFFHGDIWINTMAATSSNLAGTLVGILAGYIFYKYRDEQIFTKKIHTVWWWCLSFGMGFATMVLPGIWIFSENYYPSMWFSLPYFALGTTIFVSAIAIGLFGGTKGVGWMAKWCVEWNPLYVLGRLTYGPYLVHYALILIKAGSSRQMLHMTNSSVIVETIEILMCSLLLGFLMAITVELPVTALQSIFLKVNVRSELKIRMSTLNSSVEDNQKNEKSSLG